MPAPITLSGDAFGSRIARKLFVGYIVPLVVLIVAGVVLPLALWSFLDRYQQRYETLAEESRRVESVHRAAVDFHDMAMTVRGDRARQPELRTARRAYQEQRRQLEFWLEENPDPQIQPPLNASDQAFQRYSRDAFAHPDRFEEFQGALDRLRDLSLLARDESNGLYRRADWLRRIAFILIPTLALALAALIGRHIALGLTEPLVSLTRTATRISQRDDHDLLLDEALLLDEDPGPDDEIGDLRRAFRRMMLTLGRREAVLRAQNEALGSMRRRLEAILNATDDGIAMLDRSGSFSVVSDRFAQLCRMEIEELQDNPFSRIAPRLLRRFHDPRNARKRLREVLRSPEDVATETFEVDLGGVRVLRVFSAPVRAEDETGSQSATIGRVLVLRDVTRETEVDRMKTEFVSTVSHELRTPLTAIKGYVDLILAGQTGPLTDTQREFLALTGESTERLTALINDILDISRIEAGTGTIRRHAVPYLPVVRQTLRMLAGQARQRQIHLKATLPNEGITVLGDRDRMGQALANLIANAIKYTQPRGHVRVTVEASEGTVTTRIADTGIGIARDDLERIFEKFYRADNTTTRATGGTGLGLPITRAIVERLGGTIQVESELGGGSVFTVTLPRAEAQGEAPPETDGDEDSRRLYLVVDGAVDARDRSAHSLREPGVAVSAASNAVEALRRARGLRPDALLVDLFSPGMDGPALLRELRHEPRTRQIPVLLTGLSDGVHLCGGDALTTQLATLSPAGPVLAVGASLEAWSGTHAARWLGDAATALGRLPGDAPSAVALTLEGDGVTLGELVRAIRRRYAEAPPELFVVGDLSSRVATLTPPGGTPPSLERLARALARRLRHTEQESLSRTENVPL